MAALTTVQLLYELRQSCERSSLVSYVEERVMDDDTLSVRVHLATSEGFINVFYNVATGKAAFALMRGGQRLYGVDNAKIGWHKHPFDDPARHIPCAPMRFEEFLAEVEAYFSAQAGEGKR